MCALISDGTIKCWGTLPGANSATAVSGITNAVDLSISNSNGSSSFACAVLATGSIKCWGTNGYGQL